jgi:signal transduction histidine kinase
MSEKLRTPMRYVLPVGNPGISPEEAIVLDLVNCRVCAAATLDAVMDFVFETTSAICPCDRISVALLEEDGRHLVTKWVRTSYEPVLLGVGYADDITRSSLRTVIERGAPRIIDDLEAYFGEHPRSASTELLFREGVRSSITCPLLVEDRVIGAMFRSTRQKHAYGEHQLRLHQSIAERLSQAIEKTYRIEQLAAAKQSFSEMLGFVSHELKNPLTSLLGDTWALRKGLAGEISPQQTEYLRRIESKADYITTLIRDYLDLARLESDELAIQCDRPVDFAAEVISPVVEMLRSSADRKKMPIEVVCDAIPREVNCDSDLMKVVVSNLLSNAIKYGVEKGAVRLRARQVDAKLQLSIFNEGPGFPLDQRSRLFRRFSRVQSEPLLREPGHGVGLYNAWRIIQLHHGEIHADSVPGSWAEFSIEIPIAQAEEWIDPQQPARDTRPEPSIAECEPREFDSSETIVDEMPHENRPCVLVIDDDPDVSGRHDCPSLAAIWRRCDAGIPGHARLLDGPRHAA